MFERFTDRARRVVVLAQEEARLLKHNYIGTEHVLLGLVRESDGVAAKALEQLGISLDAVRSQVEAIIGEGGSPPGGNIPFTPRAKKVLELSLREARQLGHDYIGTEHILLGLVREGQGVAAEVLATLGADLARVRGTVVEMLEGPAGTGALAAPDIERRVPYDAIRLAGDGPVGSEHYLLALFAHPESRAGRALRDLGVTREAAEGAVARLDPPAPGDPEAQAPAGD